MTQETIRNVYGIDCEVIESDGSPHVILKSAFDDEEIEAKKEKEEAEA